MIDTSKHRRHPLETNNKWGKRWCLATMTMLIPQQSFFTVTPSHGLLRGRRHYCCDKGRLFLWRSRGRFHPHTEPGAALANIVQAHQPFKRGGPIAKTSQGTSSNEEFPMGNTSRSTSGWRIEPQESLLPIPNTERGKEGYLEWRWNRKKERGNGRKTQWLWRATAGNRNNHGSRNIRQIVERNCKGGGGVLKFESDENLIGSPFK